MRKDFIRKDVGISKVASRYQAPLRDAKDELLQYADKIHSIYLYGSVGTGKARSPSSDLDLLVVLHTKPSPGTKSDISMLEAILSKKYQKLFREVGITITYKSLCVKSKESYGWRFFLTVLCDRMYGPKLYTTEMKFFPSKKLARNLHGDIRTNIEAASKKIRNADPVPARLQSRSIMKKIIRTGFSIVMEQENLWTVDLKEMASLFSKHYPEKREDMRGVVSLANSSAPDRKTSIEVLDTFGKWMTKEFFAKT